MTVVKKTNIISVKYQGRNAAQAQTFVNTVGDLYLERHTTIHHNRESSEFFAGKSNEYKTQLDEAQRSAWCREQGLFPDDLQQWRQSATAALSQPEEARASPQETRDDRRRIKELERDLRRKEKALAETAALLVLSKKLEALFQPGGDE